MLEHSRIYGFGPRANMKVYLASADLMTRNMDKRVEIAWPVLDEKLRDRILSYIDVSLSDTAKLRELLPNRRYTPLGFFAQVSPEGKTIRFDSQAHFMDEARLEARMSTEVEVEREVEKREAVAAAEPATPVTATAPAAAAAAPAGAASAVASGATPTAAANADASANPRGGGKRRRERGHKQRHADAEPSRHRPLSAHRHDERGIERRHGDSHDLAGCHSSSRGGARDERSRSRRRGWHLRACTRTRCYRARRESDDHGESCPTSSNRRTSQACSCAHLPQPFASPTEGSKHLALLPRACHSMQEGPSKRAFLLNDVTKNVRWPASTPLGHTFFPINQLIWLLQLPYAVFNLPVNAALPCFFPRRGRVLRSSSSIAARTSSETFERRSALSSTPNEP